MTWTRINGVDVVIFEWLLLGLLRSCCWGITLCGDTADRCSRVKRIPLLVEMLIRHLGRLQSVFPLQLILQQLLDILRQSPEHQLLFKVVDGDILCLIPDESKVIRGALTLAFYAIEEGAASHLLSGTKCIREMAEKSFPVCL